MNYNYLSDIMKRAKLPQAAITELMDTAHTLSNDVKAMMDNYLADYCKDTFFDFKDALQKVIHSVPAKQNEAVQLIFSFLLTEQTERLYKKRGLSDELFDNMLLDLKTKNEECQRYYGHWGTFVAAWFCRWFTLERIAFERLQMEMTEIGRDYRHLNAQSVAINVHIPAIGPLYHDACLRDYKRAAKFFADDFKGQDIAFICDSWLLHPEHPDFLPPTSRLLAFQEDFDIVHFYADPKGNDLWRLYGIPYDGYPEHLTERNSLERAYKKFLLGGGVSGIGIGIFLYEDLKQKYNLQ